MGKTFENLTLEELCDLMCGKPEEEAYEEEVYEDEQVSDTHGSEKKMVCR